MAQMVERVLGKDEVTGSIPVSSSMTLNSLRIQGLFSFSHGLVLTAQIPPCFLFALYIFRENVYDKMTTGYDFAEKGGLL